MRAAVLGAAFILLGAPPDSTDPAGGGGSHDLLYGTIFTGIVTLVLGYLTYRTSRHHRENAEEEVDPRDTEIEDLKMQREDLIRQRDTVQRKLDNLRETSTHQRNEIARLREKLLIHRIDPNPDEGRPRPSV